MVCLVQGRAASLWPCEYPQAVTVGGGGGGGVVGIVLHQGTSWGRRRARWPLPLLRGSHSQSNALRLNTLDVWSSCWHGLYEGGVVVEVEAHSTTG